MIGASRPSNSAFSRNSNLPARLPQKTTFLPSRGRFSYHASIPGEVNMAGVSSSLFDVSDGRMTGRGAAV